jgi:sortase A
VLRDGNSLVKVGVILMALALTLAITTAAIGVTLRSERGRVVPAEVARKSVREAPPPSSGKPEESPRYDDVPSPSGEPVRRHKEDAKEPVVAASGPERSSSGTEMPRSASQQTSAEPDLRPQQHQIPQQEKPLPAAEDTDWPKPNREELKSANAARHYELLPGAILGLTIRSMGLYNAPVFDSRSRWALANGVAHVPETSLPWSPTPQRNVYLAGHRMGYRGTWSRMIFYNLDKLKEGDKVVLKDRTGRSYEYRVSETFLADPADSWVMGQVRGRDMLTLQTCTPYPTFQKRLIVRADRV